MKRPFSPATRPTTPRAEKVARVEEDSKDLFTKSWDKVSAATLDEDYTEPKNRARVESIREKRKLNAQIPAALRPSKSKKAREAFLRTVHTIPALEKFQRMIASIYTTGNTNEDRMTGDPVKARDVSRDIADRIRVLTRKQDPSRTASRLPKPKPRLKRTLATKPRAKSVEPPAKRSRSESKLRKVIHDVARERSEEKKRKAAEEYTEQHSRKPVKRRKVGPPLKRKDPDSGDPKGEGFGRDLGQIRQ